MVILMQSYYEKYLKTQLISTNICVKLSRSTVPSCIGIGIGIGPLYTLLKKTITPNSIGIGLRIGTRIGVGQCKHTISLTI